MNEPYFVSWKCLVFILVICFCIYFATCIVRDSVNIRVPVCHQCPPMPTNAPPMPIKCGPQCPSNALHQHIVSVHVLLCLLYGRGARAVEVHDFGVESATLPSLSQMGKGWYFQLFMLLVATEWWGWMKSRWSWTSPTNPMSPTNSTNLVL